MTNCKYNLLKLEPEIEKGKIEFLDIVTILLLLFILFIDPI